MSSDASLQSIMSSDNALQDRSYKKSKLPNQSKDKRDQDELRTKLKRDDGTKSIISLINEDKIYNSHFWSIVF